MLFFLITHFICYIGFNVSITLTSLFSVSRFLKQDIVLPEGGRNRERVIECEVNFRKAASLNAAKQRQENLEQRKHQLEKAEQRRQTANRKAQKVERRRL